MPISIETQKSIFEEIFAMASSNCLKDCEMKSSALLCLEDALTLRNRGDYEFAVKRLITSLKYSVGVFHPDYLTAVYLSR